MERYKAQEKKITESDQICCSDEKVTIPFDGPNKVSVHTYEEPLIAGHNDDLNSLNRIADKDVRTKIAEVRNAYSILMDEIGKLERCEMSFEKRHHSIEKLEEEFYRIAGTTLPENKPLII